MSDISNTSCSSSNKRRLSKIDDDIEYLTQEANNLNDYMYKKEFECSLMTVKMKREKVKALSAFARSQVILTDIEIMIAEGDLYTDIERLRNFKKLKLEREEGQSQKDTTQERNSKSESKTKKKRRHSSSRTSDETVIIPTLHENTAFVETSQTSKNRFQSLDLFGISPTNKSDSEVSLSNSIKAEFNEPYSSTQMQQRIKKSPAKKNKSDKKVESKNKSKHTVKQTESPTGRPKTVADLRSSINTLSNVLNSDVDSAADNSRTGEKKTMASSTFVPGRHNMPAVLTHYFTDMQNNK